MKKQRLAPSSGCTAANDLFPNSTETGEAPRCGRLVPRSLKHDHDNGLALVLFVFCGRWRGKR